MTLPQDAVVGFKSWVKNCLRYLRPLAFAAGLGWAWTIALGVLALYALFAVDVPRSVGSMRARRSRNGRARPSLRRCWRCCSSPVVYVVLAITIIGFAFMPIAGFGMFLATLFGKAVVLAWIGRGVLKVANQNEGTHTAIAVLIGGAIILLLYVVPVLGFLVFNLIGILGFGAVVYTLMLSSRAKRRGDTAGCRRGCAGTRRRSGTGRCGRGRRRPRWHGEPRRLARWRSRRTRRGSAPTR